MASKTAETFVTDTQTKCCYWLMALHLLCSKYERCHVLNVAENMIFHQVLFLSKGFQPFYHNLCSGRCPFTLTLVLLNPY